MKKFVAWMFAAMLPVTVSAQQLPISDFEILQLKADSAEATARYLSALLQREVQQSKALREWWAAYVAGLKQ